MIRKNHPVKGRNKKERIEKYIKRLRYAGYQDSYFTVSFIPLTFFSHPYRIVFENTDSNSSPNFHAGKAIIETPFFELKPKSKFTYRFVVYAGPKKIEEMRKGFPLLCSIVDFGLFNRLSKVFLRLLKLSHRITHNYGVDIVILTVLISTACLPLSLRMYRNMRKLQEIQPLIREVRKKYENDPKKASEEVIKVYRTHGINPFYFFLCFYSDFHLHSVLQGSSLCD